MKALWITFHCSPGADVEKAGIVNQQKLEKKFGQSSVFVASTLLENGGTLRSASPASLLKEAIHVISCGYEDKTDWGKEVCIPYNLIQRLLTTLLKMYYGTKLIMVSCRLAGFMDQLQRISWLDLRCTAMVGGLFTASRSGLHSKVLHLWIFLTGFTRSFVGLLDLLKFSSASTAHFGTDMVAA
jgi:hypothetical protein